MKHWWALIITVLALGASTPRALVAQGSSHDGRDNAAEMGLDQNYPNPVDTATRIPFRVGDPGCVDQSRTYRVTLRVYDIFSRVVATPVLLSGPGRASGGDALHDLRLTCNTKYLAYWDRKSNKTSLPVPSGIYFFRLEVDGKVLTKKMLVK